jgi:hypothetical protein
MKLSRDPNGIRTRVTAVKGRCPRPLDDRVRKAGQYQKRPIALQVICRGWQYELLNAEGRYDRKSPVAAGHIQGCRRENERMERTFFSLGPNQNAEREALIT